MPENLWLCWTNYSNLPLDDCWVSIVSSVNILFSRALPSNFLSQPFLWQWWCTQPVYSSLFTHNAAGNVATEIVPVVDWFTNPNPVFSHTGWTGGKSLKSISGHVFVSVLCCQLLHADGNPTFLRYKKLTFPYGMLWCYGSCATSFKYYMLCVLHTVWPLPWRQRHQNAMNAWPQFPALWTWIRETQ